MQEFSASAEPRRIKIGQVFSQDAIVYEFTEVDNIYGLTISANIEINGDRSLVRVILVDDEMHEYLIYEAYPLIVDAKYISVNDVCEETCLLKGKKPSLVKVQIIDASISIKEISILTSPLKLHEDVTSLRKQIKKAQDSAKINKLNSRRYKKKIKWIAGETSISRLFYEEKKKLFGADKVPNLQGAEYYQGGIFEIKSGDEPLAEEGSNGSSLVESFDWRNRHGANNPDSPYYDGDPTGSGWITPVKSQSCNHCWAFSPVHATEAFVNLYFNQHLDLDLSEQDVASCSGGNLGCCKGGYPATALNHIINTGVVDESCFPYSASCESCGNKCSYSSELIKIGGRLNLGYYENEIKQAVIDYGPITFGIRSCGMSWYW